MDAKKWVVTLGCLAALFLTTVMAGLLIVYVFHIEGFTIPAQYYEAHRDESPPNHPDVLNAAILTDEDMAAHPALSELINHRKRVLFSLDPRQSLALALEWSRYSWAPIPQAEDAYLSAYQDRIVRYHGNMYYIGRHAGIPSGGKCGPGTQC
jgi:hypothetical protein